MTGVVFGRSQARDGLPATTMECASDLPRSALSVKTRGGNPPLGAQPV